VNFGEFMTKGVAAAPRCARSLCGPTGCLNRAWESPRPRGWGTPCCATGYGAVCERFSGVTAHDCRAAGTYWWIRASRWRQSRFGAWKESCCGSSPASLLRECPRSCVRSEAHYASFDQVLPGLPISGLSVGLPFLPLLLNLRVWSGRKVGSLARGLFGAWQAPALPAVWGARHWPGAV